MGIDKTLRRPAKYELFDCSICRQPTIAYEKMLLIRVGCHKISQKHGGKYFHPDTFDDGAEEKIFHLHCIQNTEMDLSDAEDVIEEGEESNICVFCRDSLGSQALFFELELGQFDEYKRWEEDNAQGGYIFRVYGCWDCIFDGIGEGSAELARPRLGMPALAKTIDYSGLRRGIPQRPVR